VSVWSAVTAFAGACSYGHQESQTGAYQPLVFPGEARLGASALMVIDSNQIAVGDHFERYDLEPSRVEILVDGNLATVAANVRSVFSVETGRATPDSEQRPNTWVTVALFDLPTAASNAFTGPYPRHAALRLQIDGQPVPELEGVIWVIGEDGAPTAMSMPFVSSIEGELEPQTMVRLRARSDGPRGFQSSWLIGGIHAEIQYSAACLANPRAHTGSEAARGGITVGPSVSIGGGLLAAQIVLSHPKGFQLTAPSYLDATRLGTGPIIDIVFDRAETGCTGDLHTYFEVRALEVRETNGNRTVSRPGTSESNFDASEFFYFHFVDPEPAS
jgi:hypothetical protein